MKCKRSWLLMTTLGMSSPLWALGSKKYSPTPNGDIFERIVIPDARCGDGSEYGIYVRHGDPSKVLIHLQGGGACWSEGSCFGKVKFTRLSENAGIFKNKYLGKHVGESPFNDHTYVFLPYCTGDIHAGEHKARYGKKTVLHYGRDNVRKSLAWLEQEQSWKVSQADDIVLYGESAGALGVMLNMDQIARLSSPHARKLALIDSPGLHFNDNIWDRFSREYLRDLDRSLASNSMHREGGSGILARQVKSMCEANPDWKFGVTQSTQDIIMSLVFGNLTTIHYFRVMGSRGLHKALGNPYDNCAAWIPDETKHIFSTEASGWKHETWDGVSNKDFTMHLYKSHLLDPHPSHH